MSIALVKTETEAIEQVASKSRQSTPEELCDWLDKLSQRIGSGLQHEVRGGELHAFVVNGEQRVEVY